ncbi:hypothetical protein [Halopenitus sp. POP-27]|uniref:hypothetical protein n=1 Tax=Halopenitus sp. POP-27 TaxID=2994425 RepID=UPI0024697972|nr:hypothetical protein [Halopenitus sp. POP-27]
MVPIRMRMTGPTARTVTAIRMILVPRIAVPRIVVRPIVDPRLSIRRSFDSTN